MAHLAAVGNEVAHRNQYLLGDAGRQHRRGLVCRLTPPRRYVIDVEPPRAVNKKRPEWMVRETVDPEHPPPVIDRSRDWEVDVTGALPLGACV